MSAKTSQSRGPGPGRTAAATPAPGRRRRSRLEFALGRHPSGLLLAAPYALFVAAVFVYPIGLGVWMSFHDSLFTAPEEGVVERHPHAEPDGVDEHRGDKQG